MKKHVAITLALTLIVSLTACGGGKNKQAFEASKAAYANINDAYEIVGEYGSDIYEAWRLGIYDKDEIIGEGYSYLAKELALQENELLDGIVYTIAEELGDGWEACSEEDKAIYRENANITFKLAEETESNLFSWCVTIVSNAYIVNGKVGEAQEYLDTAKEQMKELSEKYSDYEHYPSLKGYYTTTNSFFEFCKNPTGSFEQLKTTIEDYEATARDYNADLDYIFED